MKSYAQMKLLALILSTTSALYVGGTHAEDAPPSPQIQTQNGINFMSGGVGEGQAAAMKAAAANYSLVLTFATPSGAYLADVRVLIQDSKGSIILDAVSAGPMFLVQLPPAQYRLTAEYKGRTQSDAFSIKAGTPLRMTLRWPE